MTGGYRQVVLEAENSSMVCWLPNDDRLRRGLVITLKEIPDVKWTVLAIYKQVLTESPRRTWRVGGLG